jgi:undecaprenyl-diphosphatase
MSSHQHAYKQDTFTTLLKLPKTEGLKDQKAKNLVFEHLLQSIILGIIQGAAEWLPISSTGHLRLAEHFMGLSIPLLFDITLHIGTLIPILVFFRKDIKDLLTALAHLDFKSENGRLLLLIIIGTIPTGLIGFFFATPVENLSHDILAIALALIASGTLLYLSRFGRETTDNISIRNAIIFGIAQGIAIIPGLTRSGTTIAIALLFGTKREKAFKFSFLMSIPAVLGAQGLLLYKERHALTLAGFGTTEVLIGVVFAMVVGYFAVKIIRRVIMERKFHWFAAYCWLIGAIVILLYLNGF